MSATSSNDRGPTAAAATGMGRRTLFRVAAGVAAGLVVVGGEANRCRRARRTRGKVAVLSACTGCTGCVAACPTGAITVSPGAIAVTDELCNRCGYCAAACPIGGIIVQRKWGG